VGGERPMKCGEFGKRERGNGRAKEMIDEEGGEDTGGDKRGVREE